MTFGFEVVGPDGNDVTFGVVARYHWDRRDDPRHRAWLRTLIRYERIRRERLMDALLPEWPA